MTDIWNGRFYIFKALGTTDPEAFDILPEFRVTWPWVSRRCCRRAFDREAVGNRIERAPRCSESRRGHLEGHCKTFSNAVKLQRLAVICAPSSAVTTLFMIVVCVFNGAQNWKTMTTYFDLFETKNQKVKLVFSKKKKEKLEVNFATGF